MSTLTQNEFQSRTRLLCIGLNKVDFAYNDARRPHVEWRKCNFFQCNQKQMKKGDKNTLSAQIPDLCFEL